MQMYDGAILKLLHKNGVCLYIPVEMKIIRVEIRIIRMK